MVGILKIGIESTVIDLTKKPKILRPGIIGSKEISKFIKLNFSKKKKNNFTWYVKKTLFTRHSCYIRRKTTSMYHAQIVFGKKHKKAKNIFNISKNASLREAAANLYKTMRKIKNRGYKKIFCCKNAQFWTWCSNK